MTRIGLILIDIQQGFHDPCWGQRNNPHFEGNVRKILELARHHGQPVVHVRHDSLHPASPLRPHQKGHAFMECALPREGEKVIGKTVNSAFIGTDLQSWLMEHGITDLLFAGLVIDHCVSTTIRMAANLGFLCTLVTDATATFPRKDTDGTEFSADLVQRISVASLVDEFAETTSTAALASSWGDDA